MSWARYPKRSAFAAAVEQTAGVKVAVRVRPFTKEEIDRNCECIVEMEDNGLVKLDLTGCTAMGKWEFSFDYCFWSCDHTNKFATQDDVYSQLGSFVSDALQGFNCSILAYGQSGSGKSYSMIGTPKSLGIMYRGLKDFFTQKEKATLAGIEIELELSFMEIYNDNITDLLNLNSEKKLRVRADRKSGMYIQGLTIQAVSSYEQASVVIDTGLRNRIIANRICSSSCRSHFMCTMYCRKITTNANGLKMATDAKVNLIDLAGCESRVERSSKALRNVIVALAQSERFIPYRSSVLTNLMRECFDGNSKTTLICTISPADESALLTLSTLDYASRVSGIVSKFWKNDSEDPIVMMAMLKNTIRAFNSKLQVAVGKRETEWLREELAHFLAEMERREHTHESRSIRQIEKMKKNNAALQIWGLKGKEGGVLPNTRVPRLSNISQDPIMSGKLVYFIDKFDDKILVGSLKKGSTTDCRLVIQSGVDMPENYASIRVTEDSAKLTPNNHKASLVYVNGSQIKSAVDIYHNDRIVFGNPQICFHFLSPDHKSPDQSSCPVPFTFDDIAMELHLADFELKRLQSTIVGSSDSKIDRKRLLEINRKEFKLKLQKLEVAERKLLRQYNSNLLKLKLNFRREPLVLSPLTKIYVRKNEIDKKMETLLRDKQKAKQRMQRKITRNGHMFDYCKQLNELVDTRLKETLTMCRWSTSMAQLNNVNTVYSAFIVPYWDSTVGLPSDKVLIVETNTEHEQKRDALYEFRKYEMRHAVQAGFREIDPKINPANPFIPAMPTRFIGTVQVTDTKKSIVPREFPILTFGKTDEYCGKLYAWLDVDRDEHECDIVFSVQHIVLDETLNDNEIKILSFINPSGGFEVIEGTMADDGESYCYSESRILIEGSEGLDTYLMAYGFRVFISVFTYKNTHSMPPNVVRKLMLSQIELQHCKELLYIQERKLTVFKKTLQESEVDLETFKRTNRESREKLQFDSCML